MSTSPVSEGIALEAVMHRALALLSANLTTALASVATQASAHGLPAISTPAPRAESYYMGIGIEQVEKILSNASVAVFVFPAAPSDDLEVFSSGSPSEQYVNVAQAIQVLVAYRLGMYEPEEMFGKTGTVWDVMATRGLRYNAAVLNIFRSKLVGGSGIVTIDGSDSLPGDTRLSEDGDPIIGYASTVWSLDQYVLRPVGCEE